MSRRYIFLLVATVVTLYFSIILFMLNPLNGSRRAYYTSGHHYSLRGGPAVRWCKELRRKPPGNVVALVSYPGSGNTWLRYLLQQVTGIMTGSIYMDYGLKMHGFPGENITDGTMLVVKTHEAPPLEPDKFKSAVLLIRNPRDAILADFNRLHKGHIGTAPISAFTMKSHKGTDWVTHVSNQLVVWETLHTMWLRRFLGPVHVVYYETLVRDPRGALLAILSFLNQTVTEDDMDCALSNKEGIYRRRKKYHNFEPFTTDMYKELNEVRDRVVAMISRYYITRNMGYKDKYIMYNSNV